MVAHTLFVGFDLVLVIVVSQLLTELMNLASQQPLVKKGRIIMLILQMQH